MHVICGNVLFYVFPFVTRWILLFTILLLRKQAKYV